MNNSNTIHRAHKIRLNPTPEQEEMFWKSSGTARFAFNWGLARWQELYKAGEKPSAYGLKKEFNAIKHEKYSWVSEVSGRCTEWAFTCLGRAFKNFFEGRAKYPKFKSRHGKPMSFYAANIELKFNSNNVRLPKIGWVDMYEPLKLHGKVLSGIISHRAGRWFLSVAVETPYQPKEVSGVIGVDLGIKEMAVTSNGDVYSNIKAYKSSQRKLSRLQRKLSRQTKGSGRREVTKRKIAMLHYRISEQRKQAIHLMTKYLADNYELIALEDLNTRGMLKNRRLSKAISDVSFHEIKRQLEYKVEANDGIVQLVDRFYPSSKTCSECGYVKLELKLSERTFICESCGMSMDRDLNAAINIRNEAARIINNE